jgi:hypothetical protein
MIISTVLPTRNTANVQYQSAPTGGIRVAQHGTHGQSAFTPKSTIALCSVPGPMVAESTWDRAESRILYRWHPD